MIKFVGEQEQITFRITLGRHSLDVSVLTLQTLQRVALVDSLHFLNLLNDVVNNCGPG